MPFDQESLDNVLNGEDNQRAISDARTMISNSRCILFAGAGTSQLAGYPLWRDLLNQLKDLLVGRGIDVSGIQSADPLIAANEIYDCYTVNDLLELYHSFLCNCFGPHDNQSLDLQKLLLSIPFSGIVTPNYDDCFERAIHILQPAREHFPPMFKIDDNHAKNVRQFFDSLRRAKKAISVAHLHGVYDEPRQIILTQRQYTAAYGGSRDELQLKQFSGAVGNWTLLRKTLWALLATQRLVFVGFSMTDPFIYTLMQYVGGDLWDMTAPTHYFITHASRSTTHDPVMYARNLRNSLGVQTIFYEVVGDDHSALNDVLSKLGASQPTPGPSPSAISALLGPPA